MIELFERKKIFVIVNVILLLGFTILAGIYYYGLHKSFWFDYEYTLPMYFQYLNDVFDTNISGRTELMLFTILPYKLWGISLKSVRIYATTMYQMIILFGSCVALYSSKTKKLEWYRIAIFSFIIVILNPGSSPFCGHYSNNFHQYPYDLHATAAIFAVVSLFLLCIHQEVQNKKVKNALKILIVILCIAGFRYTDFLYVVTFVLPLLCVVMLYLWKEKKHFFYGIIMLVVVALAILHMISFFVPELESYFTPKIVWYGSGVMYGDNGFTDFREIWHNISNTFVELMAIFNIDIIWKGIISINTIIALFRIALLVFLLFVSFNIVIKAGEKNSAFDSLDYVDIVLSLGIIFNLCGVVFSSYGESPSCIRYMTIILFYGAISIARQSEKIVSLINQKVDVRSKLYFFIFFFFCILINMTTFWKEDDYVAYYEPAFLEANNFIIANQLGNGLGGNMYATTMTVLGEGQYAIIQGKIQDGEIAVIPETEKVLDSCNYVLSGPEGYNVFSEEEIVQCIGEPDEIYDVAGFRIYYYLNGIK